MPQDELCTPGKEPVRSAENPGANYLLIDTEQPERSATDLLEGRTLKSQKLLFKGTSECSLARKVAR